MPGWSRPTGNGNARAAEQMHNFWVKSVQSEIAASGCRREISLSKMRCS